MENLTMTMWRRMVRRGNRHRSPKRQRHGDISRCGLIADMYVASEPLCVLRDAYPSLSVYATLDSRPCPSSPGNVFAVHGSGHYPWCYCTLC
jgi:hypothetical protein